ncbi:MAG TPA: AMP-binding protein, partial [Mucilaginibacter sp.]
MNELSIVLGANRPELVREETLPELFRASARKYADKTALIFHDKAVTYTELDHWSDAIAVYLAKNGIGRQSYVGVWWQRGLELHAIILGIVKSGATYVPVDREIPAERVEVILQEVGAAACFSTEQLNVDCLILVPPERKSEMLEVGSLHSGVGGRKPEVRNL